MVFYNIHFISLVLPILFVDNTIEHFLEFISLSRLNLYILMGFECLCHPRFAIFQLFIYSGSEYLDSSFYVYTTM